MRKLAIFLVAALVVSGCSNKSDDDSDPGSRTRDENFYEASDSLEGEKGDLIRSEEINAPEGARAWRVLYQSETVEGEPIAVSGFIVAPDEPTSDGRPVVSWAHGTVGLADKCAPSKNENAYETVPGIQEFLDAGYVVTATDYQGLGGPGPHPFFVGISEAKGTLDIIRTAQQLEDTNAGDEVVLLGHNQGGQGVLFGGQMFEEYTSDLELKGVAAGAPVVELQGLYQPVAQLGGFVGFFVMGIYGFSAAYSELNPEEILTPQAIQQAGILETECVEQVAAAFNQPITEVIAHNPLEVPPWSELIGENTPGAVATPAPMYLFQGDNDLLVLLSTMQGFVSQLCQLGDTVEFQAFPGQTNETLLQAAQPDFVKWINARFSGEPALSTC